MKKLKISLIICSYLTLLALIFVSYDSIIPSDNVPTFENKALIIKKIDNKFKPNKDSVYEIIEKKEFPSEKSEKILDNKIQVKQDKKNNVKKNDDNEKKKFRLQIASFKEKKKSEEIASKLNKKSKLMSKGLDFTVKKKTLSSNEIFYRVVSKKVYENQIANSICNELISKNFQCILIKDY